jgi:hypothetical protein
MAPYPFFIDLLYPLPIVEKKMFGVTSYYLEDKIIAAMNINEQWAADIGIWISTPVETQPELTKFISNYRYLKRIPAKKWILLPADSDTFEEDASIIAALIIKRSPLIGTVPKKKKPQI